MALTDTDSRSVVIGAGLAGLAAALQLARAGQRVVLVEAGSTHGGCCSTTCVDGFTFNNGAVYVAVPSLLRRAFAELGVDFDAEVPMSAIECPLESHLEDGSVVHLSDATGSHAEGPRAVERTRLLREGLAELERDCAPVYRTLVDQVLPQGPSPWNALRHLWPHLAKMRGSVASLIRRRFPDSGVQAALGSLLLYTGLPPEDLPASQVIGLLALLEEGFHLPHGGMGAISDALFRQAQAAGVEFRFDQRVERIELAGGAAAGVVLDHGERIAASRIVATISGFAVAKCLLPPDAVPRRLARAMRKAPLSHRAIAVQLGCRGPATGSSAFIVNHVPALERQALMHRTPTARSEWLSFTVPTRVLPGLAPEGRSIVESFAPVSGIASASDWTPERTTDVVEHHLEGLRQRWPGLSVEATRVIDPVGFQDQRHLYEGALYGVAPGAPPQQLFPHRPGIDGLYLAGQTTFPGYGVAPSVLSGLQAAQGVLHDERRRAKT